MASFAPSSSSWPGPLVQKIQKFFELYCKTRIMFATTQVNLWKSQLTMLQGSSHDLSLSAENISTIFQQKVRTTYVLLSLLQYQAMLSLRKLLSIHALKPRPPRQTLRHSVKAIAHLNKSYGQNRYVTKQERERLCKVTDMTEDQITVWFSNRRTRSRPQPL
ncbi:hypothetical protein BC829DRAFT_304724 [Chytridium lagenaria]|nr:hypothetical protein BC829DRAFT_304724 [Chytridium lagenaria]